MKTSAKDSGLAVGP